MPASVGDIIRHRFNRGDDRQLEHHRADRPRRDRNPTDIDAEGNQLTMYAAPDGFGEGNHTEFFAR